MVDRIYWFRAPITIGGEGLSAFSEESALEGWRSVERIDLAPDSLDIFERD